MEGLRHQRSREGRVTEITGRRHGRRRRELRNGKVVRNKKRKQEAEEGKEEYQEGNERLGGERQKRKRPRKEKEEP